MSSNFEFLEKDWEILAKIGEMAEYNLYKDPNTALIKMRQLGEYIVKSIMKIERLPEPEDSNQKKRINLLRSYDVLGENEAIILEALREKGNKAVHNGFSDRDIAERLLPQVVKLCGWFNELYGTDYSFDSDKITYQKPLEIDYKEAYEHLKTRYESIEKEKAFERMSFDDRKMKSKEERQKILQRKRKREETETETRFNIDEQLRNAGWETDTQKLNYKINKTLPESKRNMAIAEWPCIKEDGEKGYVDYALFCGKTLIGVVEAKRNCLDVGGALRRDGEIYSTGIITVKDDITFEKGYPFEYNSNVPFIFASNGRGYNKDWIDKSGIWFLDVRKKKNLHKAIPNFFSPDDLKMMSEKDDDLANEKLKNKSTDYLKSKDGLNLRYYQLEAVQKVEEALINGQHKVLLTMATGTGKTITALAILYRLLESQKYKRILFVVDRASLGTQARDTFANVKILEHKPITDIYRVDDLDIKYPDEDTRVHIATVQGLIKRVLQSDDPLSIGKYDCIVIDEAHRGYILDKTVSEDEADFVDEMDYLSKYRYVVDYFQADKIALTATPALHTYEIFGEPVYEYSYRQAVLDGYLVDFEPVKKINTELNTKGIDYEKGEEIKIYDRESQETIKGKLEDELHFDVDKFNKKVIVESFNREVCKELVKNINPEGPSKTLIFATSDEHADMIVRLLYEAYVEDGTYDIAPNMIAKITGSVKDVGKLIKKYKYEDIPTIAVTVDLLTTGIDVPKITTLVFLRKVKSRILYEQMVGRATRRCDEIDKEYFTIYDAVGIYDDLEKYSDMKPVVQAPKVRIEKIVENLENLGEFSENSSDEREYFKKEIIGRLQRKRKIIEGRGEEIFQDDSKYYRGEKVANLKEYIGILNDKFDSGSVEEILAEKEFLIYLDTVKVNRSNYQVISDKEDRVLGISESYGDTDIPEDYLESFKKYVNENIERIEGLKLLKTSSKNITRKDLETIRKQLDLEGFSEVYLNNAYSKVKKLDITVGLLTFIKNAIKGSPLKGKNNKIRDVMNKIYALREEWTDDQEKILKSIEALLKTNDFITEEDFKEEQVKVKLKGNYKSVDKKLNGMLSEILDIIKDEIILN